MGTTAEKLQKVLDSKNAIKTAINNKGGNVGNVMSEYASAIENLSTGLDTSDATATSEDILLNKTAYVKNKKITGVIAQYEGVSSITPLTSVQYVRTKSKLVTKDIVVQPIPYYEVDNATGQTIIIGGN